MVPSFQIIQRHKLIYKWFNLKYVKPLSCFYNAATQNENNSSVARYIVTTEANNIEIQPNKEDHI